MNPEFRRQLWLQFSPTRLIVMPALLILLALAVVATRPQDNASALAGAASIAFVIIIFGMGIRAASASIVDEIRERTWDQQRMSAMQPWAMTWGKLAGATSYSWYGGAICAVIYVMSAASTRNEDGGVVGLTVPLLTALGAVLAGVLFQALALAVNLQLSRFEGRAAQRSGSWGLLLLAIWLGSVSSMAWKAGSFLWWGIEIGHMQFIVLSLMLFAGCALVAAWRCMAGSLAVRQLPWGWPALALLLTVYVGGIASMGTEGLAVTGAMISFLMTYAALVTEPQPRPLWQRLLARLASGQYRLALQQLPLWPTTLVLTFIFAVGVTLSTLSSIDHTTTLHHRGNLLTLAQAPLAVGLLLLRDCAIALFFAFHPRARRPLGAFLLVMLVLWLVLPWTFMAMSPGGESPLLYAVMPPAHPGTIGTALAALHAGIALALLRWRWKQ
ncbi:MAG: hypothetical protein RLZZ618_1254 [Pseudomonadota bacterium]|jgi:hypothetical protein